MGNLYNSTLYWAPPNMMLNTLDVPVITHIYIKHPWIWCQIYASHLLLHIAYITWMNLMFITHNVGRTKYDVKYIEHTCYHNSNVGHHSIWCYTYGTCLLLYILCRTSLLIILNLWDILVIERCIHDITKYDIKYLGHNIVYFI